ncbi:hypothetical protein ACP4OV_029895 [Aristida adscensionis]
MEAAAVAGRGGLLAQARPGRRAARARTWGHGVGVGVGPAQPVARRRRLLVGVASPEVGETLPAPSLGDGAVAMEEMDEEDVAAAEALPPPPPDVPVSTVRVKFVLQKQCAFGQQFLVVGDDPAIGLWNPGKAIALDWSEGHVWTARTDLPANKVIEFKFLLRDASGHVRWQHGANRALQATETPNTLVVHEDWDHAKKQEVLEEEDLLIGEEEVGLSGELAGSNGAMVAHRLQTDENLETNKSSVVANDPLDEEMVGANGTNEPQIILEKDQKILDELYQRADTAPQNGNASSDYQAGENDDDTITSQEGAAVANRSISIFESDLSWARKALHQLLRSLGFQIGTTRT